MIATFFGISSACWASPLRLISVNQIWKEKLTSDFLLWMRSHSTSISKVMSSYNNGDPMVPCRNRSCMPVQLRKSSHLAVDTIFSNLNLAVKAAEYSKHQNWWYQEGLNQTRSYLFFIFLTVAFSFLCFLEPWKSSRGCSITNYLLDRVNLISYQQGFKSGNCHQIRHWHLLRLLNCILSGFIDGKVVHLTFEINEASAIGFP